jgi:hypothetical protein
VGRMQSLFFIGHLHSSGIWPLGKNLVLKRYVLERDQTLCSKYTRHHSRFNSRSKVCGPYAATPVNWRPTIEWCGVIEWCIWQASKSRMET